MKRDNKGQITTSEPSMPTLAFREGEEVTGEGGCDLRVARVPDTDSTASLARHLTGRGSAADAEGMSTDQLMELLRGE